MITRSLSTALAAGLLSIAAGASFAYADVAHVYQGGPKTVITAGTADRHQDQIRGALVVSQNDHRYYGGPKYP
jgi:hypothetical protein